MWPSVIVAAVIAFLATRRNRRAFALAVALYAAFLLLSVLYIPSRAGFHLTAPDCEWKFGVSLALYSFGNYQHIVLMAFFYLMTFAILRRTSSHPFLWSGIASLALGFVVELEEGAAHFHHCRMRDLIPDATGALAAAVILFIVGKAKARTIENGKGDAT
jgi:hypothetical protein